MALGDLLPDFNGLSACFDLFSFCNRMERHRHIVDCSNLDCLHNPYRQL